MDKVCPSCLKDKAFSDFYPRKRATEYSNSAAGYQTICKVCFREQRAKYVAGNPNKCRESDRNSYLKNPDSKRNGNYKRNFGITLEEYNQMFASQKGCCLGCERHQSDFKKRLAVD